jgi:ubiquinone/menaquinone biosynthesis C-methylase UbiE
MNKLDQYKKQRNYFDKEFSAVKEYELEAWQESYIERIKNHVLDKQYKKKTLLDIATGRGYIAIEMAKLGMNVIACDLSPEAIKNLKKYKKQFNLKNLKLMVCKAEELPLKDESVDYVTANAILEHIPEEEQAISEWKRVLKKKGKMFIVVPLKFRYILPFLWLPNYLHDKQIGHLRRYDLKTLQKRFKLPTAKYFYTGHLIKVLPIILSKFINNPDKSFHKYFEKKDQEQDQILYGANNITVIFKK